MPKSPSSWRSVVAEIVWTQLLDADNRYVFFLSSPDQSHRDMLVEDD
jgi:hypothetical protein